MNACKLRCRVIAPLCVLPQIKWFACAWPPKTTRGTTHRSTTSGMRCAGTYPRERGGDHRCDKETTGDERRVSCQSIPFIKRSYNRYLQEGCSSMNASKTLSARSPLPDNHSRFPGTRDNCHLAGWSDDAIAWSKEQSREVEHRELSREAQPRTTR